MLFLCSRIRWIVEIYHRLAKSIPPLRQGSVWVDRGQRIVGGIGKLWLQDVSWYPPPHRAEILLVDLLDCHFGVSQHHHWLASQPVVGYGPPPGITFDRFVRACVTVKTLTEAFQRYVKAFAMVFGDSLIDYLRLDTDRDGWIQINYEQFMNVRLAFFFLKFLLNSTRLDRAECPLAGFRPSL